MKPPVTNIDMNCFQFSIRSLSMKNHHEVGHFKNRLMIVLLSLFVFSVMVGQSFAATSCSSCHRMPPLDSADGLRKPATGAFKGNHQTHLGTTAVAAECYKCHNNVSYDMKHADTAEYKIQISSNINSSGTYSKGSFFNQTSIPVMGSCSNVNCHFEKNETNRTPAPVWGSDPAGTTCSTCHATPRGVSGSHAKHEAKYTCDACHPSYGSTNFSHATSAGKHKIVVNTFLDYSGGTVKSWLPSQTSKFFGTCAAASCHANVYGAGTVATPVWGTASGCEACHSTYPITAIGPDTGSHQKHAGKACTECHALGTTATSMPSTNHIDGSVNITVGYSPSTVAKHAAGSGYSSCSNVSCHSSNGKFSPASALWGSTLNCKGCHATLSAGHNIHISTLFDERASSLSYTNYSANASAGLIYKFGCANCHPVNIAKHLDGFVDVDLNTIAGSGALKGKNPGGATYIGGKCNNVYCHSNGFNTTKVFATTPDWGTGLSGDRCAACHGNSPNTTITGSAAHSAHTVGIHYDDIYNGVSRKLPQGGGNLVNAAHGRNNRSTTINCNMCHAATINEDAFANDKNFYCAGCHDGALAPGLNQGVASIANTFNHVNGKVEVVFINKKIATKAQVAQSAFAAYTAAGSGGWSRNNNIYKTYTSGYDVTKATLASSPAYTTGAGCAVSCHSKIAVKWNDPVTCTSCHTRLR